MTPAASLRVRELMRGRALWLFLLLAIALAYYGSYYRHGIGFRDEGQTVAFGAQRLLHGETPLKDVVLNYNVLWFYPVVALYKIFGVSYVLMRGYLLAISALAALLSFFLVEKTTRKPWVGFLVAVILILIPGTPGKNYIPLLAIANTLCLVHFALAPHNSRAAWWKLLIGGVVLGSSFLLRVDIALIFTVLWLGLLILRLPGASGKWAHRTTATFGGVALLAGAVAVVHVPFVVDAQRRGFLPEFLEQYQESARFFTAPLRQLEKPRPAAPSELPAAATPARPETPARVVTAPAPGADKKALKRATIKDVGKEGQNVGAAFLILLYAPVATVLIFVCWGLATFVRGLRLRAELEQQRGLAVLVLMGGALSTFPQFFFWRPDLPHLSEFMPGFVAATAAAAGVLWAGTSSWRNWRTLFTALLVAHVGLYVVRVLPDRWAGTYAIRHKRTKFFTAENGVNVYVTARELAGLTTIQKLLREFAPQPTDYIVAYPYSPGINLLANRPTYERNVYVDNATGSIRWQEEAIARFEKFRPAVIVLSDWDINGTEASRLSIWALKMKTWIQTNYVHQGTYIAGSDAFEIYTRP